MENTSSCQISAKYQLSSCINWLILYKQLIAVVTRWVRYTNLPTWIFQREEIIDEIVQETMLKVVIRIRRGESGELSPVYSVEGLCLRVAHNVFIDMVRHDRRFLPLPCHSDQPNDYEDYSDIAVDNVYNASLFTLVALAIQDFPPKLRAAVIIDLVSRMSLNSEKTTLQQALLNAGIDLEEFCGQRATDQVMKSRQSSLASLGYKKISKLACIQEYV